MKRSFVIAASLLLLAAVLIERGGLSWEWERPLIQWLAKKTGHQLPEVTAVVLPITENLHSQSTGTANNSVSSNIIPAKAGIVSLSTSRTLRDGVPSAPCSSSVLSDLNANSENLSAPSLIAPQDVALAVRALLSFHPDRIVVATPLGDLSNGPLSLLREAQSEGSVQGIPFVFTPLSTQPLSDRWLPFLWSPPSVQVLSLDDLLLRREEMERGSIKPDLEILFQKRTVFIGGAEAPRQAAMLQDAEQKSAIRYLSPWLYGVLFVVLALGMLLLARFSEIDFLLILFFCIVLYSVSIFFIFHFFEILLPILLPSSLVLIACLKKQHFNTANGTLVITKHESK
ncbi:MAG: hypothetical protein ACOYK6_04670 [Chthoniobacterales bacterium]